MRRSMKKSSVLMVALMVLLSVTVVYAAPAVPTGLYDSNDFEIAMWKDGSTLSSHTDSKANDAIVPNSWNLDVTGNGGTLTFDIQTVWYLFIPGNMTGLEIDFDGDGTFETVANVSNDTVTLDIPSSELTQEQHLYTAKVYHDVGIPMTNDIEFYIDLSNCN